MAQIPALIGGGAGATGWLKIADVDAPAGVVLNKVYQDDPNNTILQSCSVTDLAVEVLIRSAFPKVTVNGVDATLPQSTDGGHYSGTVNVTLTGSETISALMETPDGNTGASDHVDVVYDPPPEILTLSFTGGYPGSQVELKAGDAFQLSGTTDKDIDAVQIQDFGAMVQSLESVAVGTSFTVTGTIADRGDVAQLLSAKVQGRDAVTGALGTERDTNALGGGVDGTDVVNLNNLYPTATWGSPTYPGSQQALKGSESATVPITTANLNSIVFDSPNGDLSITNPVTDETPKTVSRIAGSYNITTPNLRATATRIANDAVTVSQTTVNIADAAAVVQVVSPASRLRSGGNDGTSIQNHTITIQSDQQLLSVAMDEDTGGGTFTGSWAGGPTNWTRTLQVHDDDTKGNYDWQNLVATNLAGVVTNTITGSTQYTLGGFVARTLTFAPFATTTSMGVETVDFSKLSAGIFTSTNQTALKQPIGTPPPVTDGYTIQALGVKPTIIVWLDTAAAGANSSGTAQITDVQEAV